MSRNLPRATMPMLSPVQISGMLQISKANAIRMMHEGEFGEVVRVGKQLRVYYEPYKEWLEEHTVPKDVRR